MQQEPNVVGSGKMEERKRGKRMKLFNNTWNEYLKPRGVRKSRYSVCRIY